MFSVLILSSRFLLQDIDANFSKMQQVLSNRILPAFKRYSIGTEPAREAAKVYMRMYIRDIPRMTIPPVLDVLL